MGPVLNQLRELQKVERALRDCQNRKAEQDRSVRIRQTHIERLKAELEELVAGRKKMQIATDEKDLELKSKQAQIERLRGQLNTLKSNREYAAMQNEIKFAEIAVSRIEDEILSDLAELEDYESRCKDARRRVEEEQKNLAKAIEDAERAAEQLDAEIQQLTEQKARVQQGLPPEAIGLFDRIARRYDGEAMATVGKSGSEAVCQGCSMRVPQNVYLLLHGNTDDLITCQNCSRILYLGE